MKKIITAIVGLFVLIPSLPEFADAIPAFARKYDMSCNTCHSPAPRLKAFGDEFASNGFVLEGQEPPRYYRETGDDQLMLLREIPLAIRFDGYFRYQPEKNDQTDVQFPYLIKLLSGAQIAKNFSYYFYFFFNERGEVAGLEDAYLMFNNVFAGDLDIYVGQFQVSDPLFKRELRLTFEDYQVYRVKPGNSSINLTYDRGIMVTYGLPSKTDLVLEFLNGNGIDKADANRNFDTDKYKNVMARISQEINENIRLGIFGYYGNEAQAGSKNSVRIAGPDLTLSFHPIELNVQYVWREDNNPLFNSTGLMNTNGAFAELVYTPDDDRSTWYGVVLYNWVKSPAGGLSYQSATCTGNYLLGRNVRLLGEYTYDIEKKANKITIGIITAF